ncbi:putative zinc- or iron-chelating domain containing protein [Vibrio phage 1.215.B._10N.222.54.F7]|nr:putative zinc- or iron-chelating domain containing protein [Vibrio phage 1.215.A._10N.222.54.F7]AUR96047.1 putative zinc- or iron-chelating domain containing protein [Vibrio phage 1.215.B._10N.222.54.F7]
MSLCQKEDGSFCNACCTVISLYKPFKHGEVKAARRAFNKRAKLNIEIGMLRRISKRLAKKRNPFLVAKLKKGGNFAKYTFYKCIHLKGGKCNIYDSRPYMCHGYPFYGQSPEHFLASDMFKMGAQYDKDCGYYDRDQLIAHFKLEEGYDDQ